jgi:hypothetical protein
LEHLQVNNHFKGSLEKNVRFGKSKTSKDLKSQLKESKGDIESSQNVHFMQIKAISRNFDPNSKAVKDAINDFHDNSDDDSSEDQEKIVIFNHYQLIGTAREI